MSLAVHVIDFEGNGRRGIAEWGVVSLAGQEITATHTRRCRPYFPPEEAPEGCADFEKYADFFLQLRRTGLFCAHHSHVEDNLLRRYWASPGYVPGLPPSSPVLTWGPWLDTRALWARLIPNRRSCRLMDLLRGAALTQRLRHELSLHCPTACDRPHTALHDALASSLLLRHAMELAPQKTLEDWVFYSQPMQDRPVRRR